MTRIVAVVALLLVCSGANAQFIDGSDFIEDWRAWQKVERVGYDGSTETERRGRSQYQTLIFGVVDGTLMAQEFGRFKYICLPDNVTGGQLFQIVSNWLEANPAEWNLPAVILVWEALNEAWPERNNSDCPE